MARLGRPGRAAAHCLARGDPLGALMVLAAREDAHARALRGIALSQLGEFEAARELLTGAARAFAEHGLAVHRARALAAAGEVAAGQRDFRAADALLGRAVRALVRAGDRRNAAWALAIHARLRALAGDTRRARALLASARRHLPAGADRALRAQLVLAGADERVRRLDAALAAEALARLAGPARPRVPALARELEAAAAVLARPLVHVRVPRTDARLQLDARALAEALSKRSSTLAAGLGAQRLFLVDESAQRVRFGGGRDASLRRRPVLFALLARLATSWPRVVSWRALACDVFGFEERRLAASDDSLRLRAKVEIARLRRLLPRGARIAAERNAWRLVLPRGAEPVLFGWAAPSDTRAQPADDDGLALRLEAFLSDGLPWAVDDLATAAGHSRSSVLRALRVLLERERVEARGRARARRYVARFPAGIASQMLLVGLLQPGRG